MPKLIGRFCLSDLLPNATVRDAGFRQTQFSSTTQPESCCFVASARYLEEANANSCISCIVTTADFAPRVAPEKGVAVAEDPVALFFDLHNRLVLCHGMAPEMPFGVHPTARVHEMACVSERVFIGENAVISAGTVIEPFSYIGKDVSVGPSAVIGAVGHHTRQLRDRTLRVEHAGGVRLEDGVQVLAGAIVSKAVHTDFTVIGAGSVISIRAHVGHGCRVGRRCILAGSTQVSGYSTIGDNVWIGPSAVIGNKLSIGTGARIEIGSVVVDDVPPGRTVSGNFAYDHLRRVRAYARDLKP